jgi:hypothetical protein
MKLGARLGATLGVSILLSGAAWRTTANTEWPQGTHPANDLVVHEWGTFTSVAGEDGTAVDWDALGCKSDLPKFVYDQGYRGLKGRLTGTVRMETPVVYFYSPGPLEARVNVRFPNGLITEWYPKAENKILQRNNGSRSMLELPESVHGIDASLKGVTGGIEWPSVMVQPDTTPAFPRATRPDRYYSARETDAAPVEVGGDHEKFLFYRGVGRFQVPLSARVVGDNEISVENRTTGPISTVILFESRGGRIGYRLVDSIEQLATIESPSLDGSRPSLVEDLESALVEHGLFPREAHAMVKTWKDSWFEEGSRLIYIVPQSAVDTVLPLHIDPVPSQTVRVFVGRIELLTPKTTETVEQAMANGDRSTIERYARFLGPILARIASGRDAKAHQLDQFRRNLQGFGGDAVCQ